MHAAFFADILAHPEDDTPRLVYADWLEDNGQPERAEFIRIQIELERRRRGPLGPVPEDSPWLQRDTKYHFLRRRERELLDAHRGEWFQLLGRRPGFGENLPLRWWPERTIAGANSLARLGTPILYACAEGEPRRGFVGSVTLCWEDFMVHAEALFRAAPITEVGLTDREPMSHVDRKQFGWWNGILGWRKDRDDLPKEIFACLPEVSAGRHRRWWDSRSAALAALSLACVAYGRGYLDGYLPELPPATEAVRNPPAGRPRPAPSGEPQRQGAF